MDQKKIGKFIAESKKAKQLEKQSNPLGDLAVLLVCRACYISSW